MLETDSKEYLYGAPLTRNIRRQYVSVKKDGRVFFQIFVVFSDYMYESTFIEAMGPFQFF